MPHAGDCCLGMNHGKNCVCEAHSFIDGMEEYENYIMYDEKYYGKGYLIVQTLDGEIVRYLKISLFGENSFPGILIRGYARELKDKYRRIEFKFTKDEPMYRIIKNISKLTNENPIYSIDPSNEGKNSINFSSYMDDATIILAKDGYGEKDSTDYINIQLGDNFKCKFYFELLNFYKSLSDISMQQTKNDDIKRLLKTK